MRLSVLILALATVGLACQRPLDARLAAGDVAAAAGRWTEARDAYLEATQLAADDPRAQARLGVAWWQLKKASEASAAWGRALNLDPLEVHAREGLARLALQKNEAGNAVALLERGKEPSLRSVTALARLARGSPGDAEASLALADAVLLEIPDDPTARYLVGSSQLALRRFGDAQATFERLRTSHPTLPLGSYGLARLAAAQERPTDVLLHLTEAKRRADPSLEWASVARDPAFAFVAQSAEFSGLFGK